MIGYHENTYPHGEMLGEFDNFKTKKGTICSKLFRVL